MASSAQIGAYVPQVNAQDVMPRRTVPEARGVSTGQGLEEIGGALQDVANQDAAVEAGKTMANARLALTQKFIDAQQSYQPGQDFTGGVLKAVNAYHQQAIEQTSNPIARKFVDRQLTSLGTEFGQKAMEFQASAQVSERTTGYLDGMNTAAKAVGIDPSQFEKAYGEQLAILNELKIDPDVKAKLAQQTRESMSWSAALATAQSDPYGTAIALMQEKSGNPALDRLTAVQRERLQEHTTTLQRMSLAAEEHQQVMAEKAQKQLSDTLSKQGDDLLANGQMSAKWLADNEAVLEPNEYRYFRRAMSGVGDAPSDPRVYSDLISRAAQGSDVTGDARNALLRGQLKREDYTRIVNDVASERPGWYKRGTQYLNESLNPGQLNPDPAASRSKANALADWQEWGSKNPNATDAQARTEMETLAAHYQIIPQDRTVLGMRAPRFLVGTRLQPDLDATGAATLEALNTGQISTTEAQQEAILIKRYRELYAQQQAAKAAAAKK